MKDEPVRRTTDENRQPPLVVHLVYKLCQGGLENGLINIVSRTPNSRFRHLIVALDRVGEFAQRLPDRDRQAIGLRSLDRGHAMRHLLVFRLLRRYRPAILHTRNLPTIEFQLTAMLAGVPARIHSEHGRDVVELNARRGRYRAIRRIADKAVTAYIAVHEDIAAWLRDDIGIGSGRVEVIHNGVDAERFKPAALGEERKALLPAGLRQRTIIGTVGRMAEVKDHLNMVNAFLRLRAQDPEFERKLGLVIVGDGVNRLSCLSLLERSGAADAAWLPGTRFDVDRLYRAFDIFVLPSLTEGMSNTLLEAMAAGLPVVATDVGAARDVVAHGNTGLLVPPQDSKALADSLSELLADQTRSRQMGEAGRARVVERFSLDAMVDRYLEFYASALQY